MSQETPKATDDAVSGIIAAFNNAMEKGTSWDQLSKSMDFILALTRTHPDEVLAAFRESGVRLTKQW